MTKSLTPFQHLDLTKEMRFDNEDKIISYEQKLSELLGADKEKALLTLSKAIVGYCQSIDDATTIDADSVKVMQIFHNWMCSIHNDHLIPLEGQKFPNNMVRELMIYSKQHLSDLSAEEILLCFILDGANGRKIYHGTTPEFTWHSGNHLDWNGIPMNPYSMIDTTLAIKVAAAIKNLNVADTNTLNFYTKYLGYIEKFATQHSNFKSSYEQLKDGDTFLAVLSCGKSLEIQKAVNLDTGANSYFYEQNRPLENVKVLQEKNLEREAVSTQINEVIEFLQVQDTEFSKLIPDIGALTTDEALLFWDLSEYVEKMILSLKTAFLYTGEEATRLSELLELPVIKEIMKRNVTGDYPSQERNADLEITKQVSELYLQENLHSSIGDNLDYLHHPLGTCLGGDVTTGFDTL